MNAVGESEHTPIKKKNKGPGLPGQSSETARTDGQIDKHVNLELLVTLLMYHSSLGVGMRPFITFLVLIVKLYFSNVL